MTKYPIVVEWRCKDCGRTGTAMALVSECVETKVSIAHAAAVRRTIAQGHCHGDRLPWKVRELRRVYA